MPSLTFQNLYEAYADKRYSGGHDAMSADQETIAKAAVNEAYGKFLAAHNWAFLEQRETLDLWADASGDLTGAPVHAAGASTVTVDSDTFYDNMVGRNLAFTASGNTYPIESYTSATVVDVTGDASGEAADDTVTVSELGYYPLPDDFGGDVLGPPTFVDTQATLTERPASYIRELWAATDDYTADHPLYFAVEEDETWGDTEELDHVILVQPRCASDVQIVFPYRSEPPAMTADGEYPAGGRKHAYTLKAAVLKEAEADGEGTGGKEAQEYERQLISSIQRDGEQRPRNLGRLVDPGTAQFPEVNAVDVTINWT